jgi:hypothetical protein
MWSLLLIDFAFSALVIVLPGYAIFRVLGFERATSVSFAPLASLLVMTVSVFTLRGLGIYANWEAVLLCMAAVACPLAAFAAFGRVKLKPNFVVDAKLLVIACGISAIAALIYYVLPLDSATSFYQENDNVAHLTTVREFLETGVFCSGSVISYPGLWRTFTALVASFGSSEVTVAANAVNLVLIMFIYPGAMVAFIKAVLLDQKRTQLLACCFVSAFAVFPWGLLIFGPLYPNVMGFALLPLAMVVFVFAIRSESLGEGLAWFLIFAASCCLLVYAHPNALFTGIIVLVPLCIKTIWDRAAEANIALSVRRLLCGCFVAFVAFCWIVAYKLPALRGVVSFDWPAYTTVSQAFVNLVTLALTKTSAPQLILGSFVMLGLYRSLRSRTLSWLFVSYALLALIYVADVAIGGRIQHFLAGFWYSDSFRVASSFVYVLPILAALGLDGLLGAASRLELILSGRERAGHSHLRPLICMSCLLVLIFYPNFTIPKNSNVATAFGSVDDMMVSHNLLSSNQNGLDEEEIEFLRRVHEVVGDDKVLNYPYDGSAYAYAVEGLNVVNRGWYESKDSSIALLGRKADELSTSSEVLATFQSCGIKYVLLLDYDKDDGGLYMAAGYSQSGWSGLESLNDDTPSYTVVLKQGDMRLYQVE